MTLLHYVTSSGARCRTSGASIICSTAPPAPPPLGGARWWRTDAGRNSKAKPTEADEPRGNNA